MSDNATIWLDGKLGDASAARISPFDRGLLVGDGVFDTAKVVEGTAFALRRHLTRLRRSAAMLGLALPYDDDQLRAAMEAVIAANGPAAGRLRTTVTGGPGPLGSARGATAPTVLVTTGPARSWPESVSVATVPWPRNERGPAAGLKTLSFIDNVVAIDHAHQRGAGEAIFGNTRGDLCEGASTNVFVVREGRLSTPPLASGCLGGVTRELVLEITDATEGDLPLDALADVDEAFVTSSTRDVQPISHVDGRALPSCPGPHTAAAAAAFAELAARTLDP